MSITTRQQIISSAKCVVVKVGTAVLTTKKGRLSHAAVKRIADQVHQLRLMGYRAVVVSSGAIGAGAPALGLTKRSLDLPESQAAAAVGQGLLMRAYDECFTAHGYHAAQILLTRQDFDDRRRYLNARNTILSLLDLGAVPIINENDTVAVDEITFGENDLLSALVTNLLRADLLILLSDVDGLYTVDGLKSSDAKPIDVVTHISDEIRKHASEKSSIGGRGGMASKIEAASIATSAGESVIIASGHKKDVLLHIMQGEEIGTLFLPAKRKMDSRKRWLGLTARPRGTIVVDQGARSAVEKRGKSLLASGITSCNGSFQKGDLVALADTEGNEFARGLTNYSAEEIDKIKGLRTSDITRAIGHKSYDEAIHRDNLVVLAAL